MKKRLLIISPHWSTGGSCQVTLNKIQLIKDEFDIIAVEHDFISWEHTVQRNQVMQLVKFITLREDKAGHLNEIIQEFKPDIVSMEEFPEFFMNKETADLLYNPDRTYTILETTHDSSFNPKAKHYFPDRFVFVSVYSACKYIDFDVPTEVIEYPVDHKYKHTFLAQQKLGFEAEYKHIIIVGLFTQRKNQRYGFELAHKLYDYPVKFHFIGNMAGNFESYWKPIVEWKQNDKRLDNCIIWGERSDVNTFVQAADMSLFCSKGDRNNKELNPIAIKEVLEYDMPILMYNLDVYMNKYTNYDNVFYLNGNIDDDANRIIHILGLQQTPKRSEEIVVVGTYPNLKERSRLTKECINRLKRLGRDILTVSHYPVDEEIQRMCNYYVYDSHNPLTHHSYYNRFYNYTNDYDATIFINALKGSNQSLTVLTNMMNAAKEAKSKGYKRMFYITFDVLIDDEDFKYIEQSFSAINGDVKGYFASLNTPFGKGIQTNGMTFDIDYFLETFHDVRTPEEYNKICEEQGCQNFLEDYFMKVLEKVNNESYTLIHNDKETFLLNSGLGVSSNSEYYSILPVQNYDNHFVFYFFSYNVDDRKVRLIISEGGEKIFETIYTVSECREYKKELVYSGKPLDIEIEFYDGENVYKREQHTIDENSLEKYRNTGMFKCKNRKPKIRLVHIQTTNNDEREQQSRQSLQRVSEYGWEYILHTNIPYGNLPPQYNCIRPDCVSLTLFDEHTTNTIGTALTPAHYGCYEAFKNAIISEFSTDIDYLIVCEGDCIIEVPINMFIDRVEECASYLKDNNIGYMSFGDKDTLEHGWRQSNVIEEIPNQDLMYITNHIIGLQCIMFPQFVRNYLKHQLLTHKWDAADIYFNIIFQASPYKMGILHDRITTQADGFSLIDNTHKSFIKK